MKLRSWVGFILGIALLVFGLITLMSFANPYNFIPLIIGAGLAFLGWFGGRTGLVIFGHSCIVLGCFLITLGMYLLPYSQPTILNVFLRPLFWGLFSLFGGLCANFHAFCRCMQK